MAINPSENFLMTHGKPYYAIDYDPDFPWRRIPLSPCDCIVSGFVRSYFTGDFISGFEVGINGRTSITDANGYFEIITPAETSFSITGSKSGFESYVKKISQFLCNPLLDLLCSAPPGGFISFNGNANDLDEDAKLKEEDPDYTLSAGLETYSVGTVFAYEEHISGVISDSSTSDPIERLTDGVFGDYKTIVVTGASPPGQNTNGVYRLNPFNPVYSPGNINPISITATSDGPVYFYDTFSQADVEANLTGVRQYDFEMDPV